MATVPQIIASLEASADRADTSSQQMYDVANGPATGPDSSVATDSGPVPTLLKWFADNQAQIDAQANLEARLGSTGSNRGDNLIQLKRDISNSVPLSLHKWMEGVVIDVAQVFDVRTDGTDQTAKIATALAVASVLAPCTLQLPVGEIYCATSPGNWAINGLTVVGRKSRNESTLRFGQAGVALLVDAFSSGNPNDPFVSVNLMDFTIRGNANSTHLLQMQGVARGKFRLNAREANNSNGIAYHLKGVQLSEIELVCSTDVNAMTSVPSEGLRMEAGTRAGVSVGNSSNNLMQSCRMVGLQFGTRLAGADQNTFLGGADESNTTYGCLVGSASRYNTFIGRGFENPSASSAALADAGESSQFINCYSDKNVLLQGVGAEIRGGFWERIEVQSGAIKNAVRNVRLNNWRTGIGGFFDSGSETEWKGLRGTTLTATFNGSVMTVSALAQGILGVGQQVEADGVPVGTTISSLGTGTGGTGTYNLSASVGTLDSRAVSTLAYVYPLKSRTSISLGASPFTWVNSTGQYVEVVVQSGTVSQIRQLRPGDSGWLKPSSGPTSHFLAPQDSLEVSYSVAPSMSFVPQNGFQG